MRESWKMLALSALLAAIIAGGGAFFGVAADLGANQDVGDIKTVTWMVIVLTGVVAGAKDFKTYLAKPPGGAKAGKP